MRSIALLAAFFGLALLTGLTLFYGLGAVMAAVASSRWATALVVAVRAAALAGAGIGWWALVPARQPGPSAFVVLRFIREAINSFFPVAVIGGDVIGARLLARFGVIVDLGARLQQIWRNHRGLSESFVVHLAAVFFGAAEVWIALAFMGHPVSLIEAVAIESLGQGGRAAAFMLPGGLGVQDGALIAVCAIFGVPAEIALAMALIKRVPDLVLGAPALLGWQALEGRRRVLIAND